MVLFNDLLRKLDKVRRDKMKWMEPFLFYIFNNKKYNDVSLLNPEAVKNILIVRNNKRIGNMYFLIPFVKEIRKKYPDAHITLILKYEWQREVFLGMGIDEFVFSHFSARAAFKFISSIIKTRRKKFDLIFQPYSSVEDTLICSMLSARNKIAPFHKRRNFVFTHTFKKRDKLKHAALSRLYLISELGFECKNVSHFLELTDKELVTGLLDRQDVYAGNELCIAYFRGARGTKRLSDLQWREILSKIEHDLEQKIKWIEILSPDITSPLNDDSLYYYNSNMRILSSFLKNVDIFISCDTGPLHLADASNCRCLGLYNKTDPEVFGVLNELSHNVQIEDIDNLDFRQFL
ncbi:heptosyltransferase [Aliivibrio fischeri]|nr:heptosyltransferase [Aliivibrio fischeri]